MLYRAKLLLIASIFLTLTATACSLKFEKNPDGSTRMEISWDEASMQNQIRQSIKDPQVEDMNVELQEGFITVTGTRKNPQTGNLDTMRYRLDLGAQNGHMTAVISDVVINDFPLHPDWLQPWNNGIADHLSQAGQNNPNSTFEAVTITADEVTMVWRIVPQE